MAGCRSSSEAERTNNTDSRPLESKNQTRNFQKIHARFRANIHAYNLTKHHSADNTLVGARFNPYMQCLRHCGSSGDLRPGTWKTNSIVDGERLKPWKLCFDIVEAKVINSLRNAKNPTYLHTKLHTPTHKNTICLFCYLRRWVESEWWV